MRMRFRGAVLIVALLIVVPLSASEQQACNPPAQPKMDWLGTQTGCRPSPLSLVSAAASLPCAVGEVINFKASPVAGSFQSCDGFAWSFGDPANGFASVQNPPYNYSSPGEFTVALGVFNTAGNTSTSQIITLTVQPFASEFKATPPRAIQGQEVTLSWQTTSVTKVHIDPLNLDFPPNSSYKFKPARTTVYTLVPYGSAGQGAAKTVTIEVLSPRRRAARH